jgi:hypothetical protein
VKRALLIYGDLTRGIELRAALRAVVDEVCFVPTIFAADAEACWDLIVMDVDTLSDEEQGMFLGMLTAAVAGGRLILMGEELGPSLRALVMEQMGLMNLIKKGASDEVAHLVATARKLASGEIFGLQKYLRWGGRVLRLALPIDGTPELALGRASSFVEEVGVAQELGRRFLLVTDALIHDALCAREPTAPPRGGLDLLEVTLGFDGTTLGISVVGPGRASPEKLLLRLVGDGLIGLHSHRAGGERAPWLALKNASHLIFNVAPGERSECIALFGRPDAARAGHSTPESLHLFSH